MRLRTSPIRNPVSSMSRRNIPKRLFKQIEIHRLKFMGEHELPVPLTSKQPNPRDSLDDLPFMGKVSGDGGA